MIQFDAVIKKFSINGEKTGWTYLEIPSAISQKIKPGYKKSYRIKGKIGTHKIENVSLLPSGDGNYILPLNKKMRTAINKSVGSSVTLNILEDKREQLLDADLMTCLSEEPDALKYYNTLPPSHQRYFSKWIAEAKTQETKARRIALTINSMLKHMDFGETIRSARKQ